MCQNLTFHHTIHGYVQADGLGLRSLPVTLSSGSRSRRGAGRHTTLTVKRPPPHTSDSNHLHNHANRARQSWRSDVAIILLGWECHTGGSQSIPTVHPCGLRSGGYTSPNVKPLGSVKSRIHREKSTILVCVCGRYKTDWKETKNHSDASQLTAAKVLDIISRLPGCAGQAADAVSAETQVKWKMLQNY